MSKNLDFVKRVTSKDYIDNFDDIHLVMDRVLQTTVHEFVEAGINTKADVVAGYIRADLESCGKYLFGADPESNCPVESDTLQDMIGGTSVIWEYGKEQDALGHAQYILKILVEVSSKLLWNKFFMRISVKSLADFLKSEKDVGGIKRFYKGFCDDVKRCTSLEINESTTMGDVLGKLHGEIFRPWCVYEPIKKFSGKITDCCKTVISLVDIIDIAYNGDERLKEAEAGNSFGGYDGAYGDDYPVFAPDPYGIKKIG